jgi:hypothetical protein
MFQQHQVNRKLKGSKKAFIFGPFIGELYWEAYRFAPYAISLKKRFPKHHLIVFTRPRSFDLYGQYASVFSPLVIDDKIYKENKFTLKSYYLNEYQYLCKYIKRKYAGLYEITDHFAPQIEGFMYKVKWQFPRTYMDYDFIPRWKNKKIISKLYGEFENIVISNEPVELDGYKVITTLDFFKEADLQCNSKETSPIGCFINLLKNCRFVISNFDDNLAKFAVLCGTTVVTVKEKFTDDAIHLMNPLKSIVIRCDTVEEGVEKYENYLRS